WKVCKYVKSNAIVLVRGTQTVGIGAGQMSRIDALRIAKFKMDEIEKNILPKVGNQPLVLASDAFFPFPDVVEAAAKIGVKAIIQPGGSIKDNDSIAACNQNKIAMLFTGTRHFRH
ncbi:MAG: bifunctional phosphoribosylaminoimidazolecarboxamide formyltransferase/IMP cyclohydrolase, partial [Elusimicrobiota bacterium]